MLAVRQKIPGRTERSPVVMVSSPGWLPPPALIRHLMRNHEVQIAAPQDPSGLLQWLSRLDSPCHLVAQDLGTVPALQAALPGTRPLRSLTLINPACFGLLRQLHEWESWEVADRITRQVMALSAKNGGSRAAQALVRFWFGRTAWWLLSPAQKRQLVHNLPAILKILDTLYHNEPQAQSLRTLQIPVHLICSRRAPLPSRRLVRRMCTLIPAASLSPGNRAGDNQSRDIRNCVGEWLRQQDSDIGAPPISGTLNSAWSDAS